MLNFKISETEDYEKLVPFFIENELEFSEDEPVPTDLVKCWQIVRKDEAGEEQLIGAFVLAKREDEFIVDGIGETDIPGGQGSGIFQKAGFRDSAKGGCSQFLRMSHLSSVWGQLSSGSDETGSGCASQRIKIHRARIKSPCGRI